MAIDISQVIAEWGAYYRPGSQNVKDLHKKFFVVAGTSKYLFQQATEATILEAATSTMTEVLQGYQNAWTPKGIAAFSPQNIKLFPLKVDQDFYPHDIEASWLGFMAANTLDYKDYPIVRYIAEELVAAKMVEDYETQVIYKGKKLAIVPGTPQDAKDSMDGLRVIINRSSAAGRAQVIPLGAIPTDPVLCVNYFETFMDGIQEEVREKIQYIHTNPGVQRRFKRGMWLKYNTYYPNKTDLATLDLYENVAVVGHISHIGSDKIWATIKDNAVEGTKKPVGVNTIKIEEAKRGVSLMTDFWKGVGFWDERYVFGNDVDMAAV